VCLWTQGCSKNCEGCISPELQPRDGTDIEERILADLLNKLAVKNECQGLTISGGDPFEQPASLLRLLALIRDRFADIMVYTGYRLAEIEAGEAGEEGKECLRYIDVLIDGRYVKELNTPDCVLRGSGNQSIIYLNTNMQSEYENYMEKGRIIETFVHGDKTIITGILNEVENE